MARTPFRVEILTPEGEVFNDEIEMLSTKTAVGSIGVLANHQPLLALLEPTELRLYKSDSDVLHYAQGEGYLQVSASGVLLLIDEVHETDQLNAGDLRDRLSKAEDDLSRAQDDSEEKKTAAREKRRYEAFLEMAGS